MATFDERLAAVPRIVLEQELKRRDSGEDVPPAHRLKADEAIGGISARIGFDLENLFTYHAPDLQQRAQYQAIRSAAKFFAQIILDNTPPGADQADAIRKLRECVMTANASIALRGRF